MPSPNPVATGYYKYTEIWTAALPDEQRDPLKAVLAHDALVDPQNPLHVDGVDGVSLFIGTFPSGESKLFFSSAQVDYTRYWLHAMKLTKEMIPLPSMNCLYTAADFASVSPVIYSTGGALKSAIKGIDKNNKRLKGSNPVLTSRREYFERVRKLRQAKAGTWLALDFEEWERDHSIVTELGYSLSQWQANGESEDTSVHFIVKEHRMYTNGSYVPEKRLHYNFGVSQQISTSELSASLSEMIDTLRSYGPLFLVFHDPSQDLKTLERLKIPLEDKKIELPETIPTSGLFVVDTAILFAALEGQSHSTRSLERVCNHLQIETMNLHNAGNDAYYTLKALCSMAEGDPLDAQREKRWPNHTPSGVTVKFQAHEEDEDFSDQEGLMGI